MNKHLSLRDKKNLLQKCINNGWVREALVAAKMMNKSLTAWERNSLAKNFSNYKWHYCGSPELEEINTALVNTYVAGGELDDALATAQVASKESINYLIESFCQRGWPREI